MTVLTRDLLEAPPGFRSREAALFFAQLEDQSARLGEDVKDLTVEALQWQPAPGMNTIGMLLAHIAIVEVYWTQVGPLGLTRYETESVLGIGIDDDGMPLPEGAPPPATLGDKDLGFYTDLLRRARAYARRALAELGDADLDREITRPRQDGTSSVHTMRWILYHMVEHEAGHYGQINLLQHQFRAAGASV